MMREFFSKDLRDQLSAAQTRAQRRKSKLYVTLAGIDVPILRFWQDGFAVRADVSPHQMRGLVDIFDGPRHVFQCLVVASALEDGDLICEFKRLTAVARGPALDYWREENAIMGYLPRL